MLLGLTFFMFICHYSLMAQTVKNLPAMQATQVKSLRQGRCSGGRNGTPLQYSCLKNPMGRGAWRLQSMGSQRVGYDWATKHKHTRTHTHKVIAYAVTSDELIRVGSNQISLVDLFKRTFQHRNTFVEQRHVKVEAEIRVMLLEIKKCTTFQKTNRSKWRSTERILLQNSQREWTLLPPWSWTSSLQNLWRQNISVV